MTTKNHRHRPRGAQPYPFDHSPEESHEPQEGRRRARLNELITRELETLVREEAADPALWGLRILAVELSPDGRNARVAWAVEGGPEDERRLRDATAAALERARGFLRARLADRLALKRTPQLSFRFVGVAPSREGER